MNLAGGGEESWRQQARSTIREAVAHQCLNWLSPRIEVRIEDPSPWVHATDRPPMREQMLIWARVRTEVSTPPRT